MPEVNLTPHRARATVPYTSGFTMYVALSPAMDAWRGNESTSSIGALPAVQIKTDVLASWVLVVWTRR